MTVGNGNNTFYKKLNALTLPIKRGNAIYFFTEKINVVWVILWRSLLNLLIQQWTHMHMHGHRCFDERIVMLNK